MRQGVIQTESLRQFYERTNQKIPLDLIDGQTNNGHFNVKFATTTARKTPYNRRDYFKICLSQGSVSGKSILHYNGQQISLDGPCLIFTNPSVPASMENSCDTINRYYCLFDYEFIEGHLRTDIQYSCALFNSTLHPLIHITKEQRNKLNVYFTEMQSLLSTDYPFKWEMIRNLLLLLIHEGIRLHQTQSSQPLMVTDRVVKGFFQLLNRQFPVDSPENSLKLFAPSSFAQQLYVHVNHLNSVIKKHTGKTTSAIIHERIIAEAKTLLRNADWNISEIAYALGFEYPSHFNKYFKQFTSLTPMEFRSGSAVASAHHL